jgi:LAO/AO transport system kinase
MTRKTVDDLIEAFMKGDRYALARMLTLAENGGTELPLIFDRLYPKVGNAERIGITGPPGAGKSTFVESLSNLYRGDDQRVGIIAVDPTSPFSGGALLGDRVRMQKLTLDEGTFVRSMASRGSVGGLARATAEAVDVMDAFGFDVLLIETVGVGQSEVDVASLVDTTVVVLFPGAGDMIQAMKAGLMEIADIFAVNKADQDGADLVQLEIADSLALKKHEEGWQPTIQKCSALHGEGMDELKIAIASHRRHLIERGTLQVRRRYHTRMKVKRLVDDALEKALWDRYGLTEVLDASLADCPDWSPYRHAESLVDKVLKNL